MIIPVSKRKLLSISATIILIVGGALLYIRLKTEDAKKMAKNDETEQIDNFNRNTVVSNGPECAPIGMNILTEHNGTAVDAAIATLFCEGVTVCQSMGLGGGFIATIYTKEMGKVDTILARERAPLASHKDMFVNMTKFNGILSIAVPGELKGYAELHKKYGRLSWKTLIQPTIDLCRSGHIVTKYLEHVLNLARKEIMQSPSLYEVFVNPETKDLWKAGDKIRRFKLAKTLEIIANEGPDTMYTENGTLVNMLVNDIKKLGGILTIEDFVNYKVQWDEPISTKLKGDYSIHSTGLPGSGMILALILNILNGYEPSHSVEYFHKIIESFKYSYAKRTHLGDIYYEKSYIDAYSNMRTADDIRAKIHPNRTFNDYKHYGANYSMEEDHGTAHISVLAANGDAISITSTINGIFGSLIRSESTGIILNNEMDDFATPGKKNLFDIEPSPSNFIAPSKRPLSSMCPVIVLDKNNDAVFIGGSAGGSKITTTVAYVFVQHFWLGKSLKDAIESKRIHHQLLPMEVTCEIGFDPNIIEGLKQFGHLFGKDKSVIGFTALTAISRARGYVEAVFDPRRYGSIEMD